MFGIVLIIFGTLFHEVGSSIGKLEVRKRHETALGMGFLNLFWGTILFAMLALTAPHLPYPALSEMFTFSFSFASLPTFTLRVFLEVITLYLILQGAVHASRSAFSFLRVITIPFLLIVDLILGYEISSSQLLGIGLLLLVMIGLFSQHVINTKGIWYVITASIFAVATISLYKHDITHFNSVTGEQLVMSSLLTLFLFIATFYKTKRNPLKHLLKKKAFMQSFINGAGSVAITFAYLFAASSVITTGKRTAGILWSILSGYTIFHEKNVKYKLWALLLMIFALVLLSNPF